MVSFKGFNVAMQDVLCMLDQHIAPSINVDKPLVLINSISLQDVEYRYTKDDPNVLNDVNFEIFKGERIGLIGTTGSGKSTIVDVLMGLLTPTSGRLLVDGVDLNDPENHKSLLAWRSSIAHVPQSIYLTDSTFAQNIAFGVPYMNIDMSRVKLAAEQAQIARFIESSQYGYESFVGERGIRLSGGQRQRIGIARALYKKASLLVLDEATSALDSTTEELVMSTLDLLSCDLTVIMIAYRISTIRRCDRSLY